jgi:predicted lipid-binding transport protein (Tim44 family)
MTKEEQKRIAGKLFQKARSSSSGSTSIITKIIGAAIGAIIGGVLLKFLPSFVAIIGGGVAGWFLGGFLGKRFLGFLKVIGIIAGIIALAFMLFGHRIIGAIAAKISTSQTQTATATVTQNVNFRKGPSTDNEVIRQ